MSLLHPWFLLLLVLVPFVWAGPWRAANAVHGILRTLVVALLALGLARPVLVADGAEPVRVWILDRSASADRTAVSAAAEWMNEVADGAESARDVRIVLGEDAAAGSRFDGAVVLPEGSDLGAALGLAGTFIPTGQPGAVVVATDGLATRPNWAAGAAALGRRGIPVHVRPMPARARDARAVGVIVPDELRVGETALIEVRLDGVRGPSAAMVSLDGIEIAAARFDGTDDRQTLPFAIEPARDGWQELVVTLETADDAWPGNETWTQTVAVQGPRRIAYLGRGQEGGAARLGTLLGPGFRVDAPAADAVLAALDDTDLVVLDDRPADSVPEAVQQRLVELVRDAGVGLVMSGGRDAFGPGGWHETTVATTLPVELVQREEKRDPSTALVVVIDTSGSMSGQRVQLAKEVARLCMRRLLPHDKVGIVEFYGAKRWAAPLQPASNAIELERALNRLDAGGGTIILPAIEEAFYGLQNVPARYKHVLVLTDGGIESGAFEPLLRSMAEEGINVSTVLVGGGIHSEFLVTLANWGKGRFYSVPNRFNLPEILLKQPSSAKLPAYRPGLQSVRARGGAGWWGGVDATRVPDLAGYVETRARPGAQVLLETVETSHPILATWQWGLGRVTTLATEPVGAGTASWSSWDDYGRFLARVMRRTAADDREAWRFELRPDGEDVTVVAQRRRPGAGAPTLERVDADGAGSSIPFRQRSPAHFTARLVGAPLTAWPLRAGSAGEPEARRLVVARSDLVVPETQVDPDRAIDLDRLATVTGGRVLDDGATSVPAGGASSPRRIQRWWPWLLMACLGVYVADIAWRRRPSA